MQWTMTELWGVGLAGAAAGVALAVPAFQWGRTRGADSRGAAILGVLLTGISLVVALIALRHGGVFARPLDRVAEHLVNVVGLAVCPLFVAWVRSATGQRPALGPSRMWLWTPAVAYTALAVTRPGPVPFLWILPVAWAFSLLAFREWRRAPDTSAGSSGAARELAGFVVGFALAVNVAQTIRTFLPDVTWLREVVPMTATVGFLGLGSVAMRRLLRGLAQPSPVPRYARSALTTGTADTLLARLDETMARDRLFARPGLTLAHVAAALDSTPHLVSEALNRVRGVSLGEALGHWRVAEARRRLADPANDQFTIEAIAGDCGFASRSAFYKTFRRVTGVTPLEYRQRSRAARGI